MISAWNMWGPPLAGGLLSGIVVLTGVVLSQSLRNRRETRIAVESAAVEIVMELPVFANLLTRADTNFSLGSESWTVQQRVKANLANMDAKTRKRKRAFKEIRQIVDEISARIGAAEIRRFRDGHFMSSPECVSLCGNGLYAAVFGKRQVLDETLKNYVENGLPVD
jgi:hypothetical protein